VDDEKVNLLKFEIAISKLNEKHELKTFQNAEQALEYAQSNKPDIAFLDIEMPEKNGIWLAKQLVALTIPFAFVTAHQEYAVEAFSLSAIHYVVKPVSAASISDVLTRLENIKSKTSDSEIERQLKLLLNKHSVNTIPQKIFIKNRFKVSILSLSNVLFFEASGSYTKIKTIDGELHTSSKLLRTYEEILLEHPDFLRIHRAFIINKNHVVAVLRNENRTSVQMIDNTALDVSPNLKEQLLDLLNK
jgi:two-component system LytT family response regulator